MNVTLDSSQLVVTIAGAIALLFVLWYFLRTPRDSSRPRLAPAQEVLIAVRGGYEPESVVLSRGMPAKLRFDRQEDAACSAEVVVPHFGIRRTLPAHKITTIDLQPDDAGEFEFHSGKGTLKGRIVVVA